MNKKIIWSIYILGWVYFVFLDSSYSQTDHIFSYLLFGWIPFLALHFLWKNKDNVGLETKQAVVHELLFDVASRETFTSFVRQDDQLLSALEQVTQELNAFSEKVGISIEDIEEQDAYLSLSPDEMIEFENIKEKRSKLLTIQHFSSGYVALVEDVNGKLIAGLPFTDAKNLYETRLSILQENKEKQEANIFLSKTLGTVIADAKRKGSDKINMKEINKKVDAEIKKLKKKSK